MRAGYANRVCNNSKISPSEFVEQSDVTDLSVSLKGAFEGQRTCIQLVCKKGKQLR